MTNLLWQKPGVAVDAEIQRFLAGDDVVLDREFFLHDIQASTAHAEGLQRMVGFRNIAVHDYQSLQLAITVAIIERHLDEFLEYGKALLLHDADT